jgi:hypothetical protein
MRSSRSLVAVATTLLTALAAPAALAGPGQHGSDEGHLLGTGDWGKIELVGQLTVHDAEPELIADVAVDPDGDYAYLARWGGADCAGPETGGQSTPDGGVYVIDISDPENPDEVGFIATHQDTLVGEGMQVVHLETAKFSGDVLVINHELCGKNGKAGVSLWDVTDPLKPRKLSEHFGDITISGARAVPDVNQTHSAFVWQAGDRAYLVATDDEEQGTADVDIFDVTNPKKPVLIKELELNQFNVDQPEIDRTDSNLHDMVVKQINGTYYMLLSYWDGGYVILNVNDPAKPVFVGDTDYPPVDPELLESFDVSLTPEGNAHQAEWTSDNRFIIGTDEDFDPYRTADFLITSGPNAGDYPSTIVAGGGGAPALLDDLTLSGPVVYGGYGCPASEPLPSPEDIPGYLESLQPGDETIIVLQRGPSGDPSAPEEACFPGEKAHEAALAGWDAVVIANRHLAPAEGPDVPYCGSGAFTDVIVAVCIDHETLHRLFGLDVPDTFAYPEPELGVGDVGARIEVGSEFDGWGYVWLFDAVTRQALDTFAIDEAHDPEFASGFGDLSVHEVATDPLNPSLAYLAYYSGGLRAIQIVDCDDAGLESSIAGSEWCLTEVGGYLDPEGNNFWGVETFVRDGQTYILASDRDSGLWIFRDP